MATAFDHVQYVTDIRMALGEAFSDIEFASPFTEREFYRTMIDPGFNGNIDFIEADLFFEGGGWTRRCIMSRGSGRLRARGSPPGPTCTPP